MKEMLAGLFALAACAAQSAVDWDKLPWLGDGRAPCASEAAFYADEPAPHFRATVVLPSGVAAPSVHVACAGYYRLWVNGQEATSDFSVQPLWSPFDKTIYADAYRVAFKPAPATNEVEVLLGNGFYNLAPLRFWGSKNFRSELAHGRPCFKIALDGFDGAPRWSDWTWRLSPVLRNCVYLGTVYDGEAGEQDFTRPAARVAGPKGRIVPRAAPPVRSIGHLSGSAAWLKEGKVQVVDFGKNATGIPCFQFADVPDRTRIEIVYGERLNADGSVNVLTQTAGQIKAGNGGPGAPRVAAPRDVFFYREAFPTFVPPFTWHVCRYAEVRGYPRLLRPGEARLALISSAVDVQPEAAAFVAAKPAFARIREICQRTFRANLIGVQSDCPGRERLGYGGDIVATCDALMLEYDMRTFYLKTLQDFADEAADDGWITETAPYVGIHDQGFGGRAGPISWSVAVPVLIDALIRHYPDVKDQALAYYPVCARYIRQLDPLHPDGIIPKCIGDHEALERAPNDVTATAHWYEFLALTAKFAGMLGKTDDEEEFAALAAKVKAAFAAKYVKDGVVANGTQSAQALGLYFGLVPAEQIPAAEAALVKAVEAKGYGPTTGIFSTRYMLMYLSEHGRRDVAEKIVLHAGFPGWLHMLDRGATTLWETWKESDNVYSNCHPMFGSVDEWILRFGGK